MIDVIFRSQGWEAIALLGIFTGFMLVGIAYMLAKGFMLPKLEAWARLEFRELAYSIALVAGIAFFLGIMNAIIPIASLPCAGAAAGTVYDRALWEAAECHLLGTIAPMEQAYRNLLAIDHKVSLASSFTFNIAVSVYLAAIGMMASPKAGISAISASIAAGLEALSTSIAVQSAQIALLRFFYANSFRWLLPLGILLRVFPFSRKLGATLIAIAVGTFLVYPVSILFAHAIYDSTPIDARTFNIPTFPPEPSAGGLGLQQVATMALGCPAIFASALTSEPKLCDPGMAAFTSMGSDGWWQICWTVPCSIPCPQPHGGVKFGGGVPIGRCSYADFTSCMTAMRKPTKIAYNIINAAYFAKMATVIAPYIRGDLWEQYYNPLVAGTPSNPPALEVISQHAMIVAVLAVFSIILTLVSIRTISQAVGGEVQLYGIFKLV